MVGEKLGQMTARPHYDRMAQRYSEIVAQTGNNFDFWRQALEPIRKIGK